MTHKDQQAALKTMMDVFQGGYEAGFKAANESVPGLLETLKLAVRYLEHPDVLAITSQMALHGQVPIDRAKTAIAKAEGRTTNA